MNEEERLPTFEEALTQIQETFKPSKKWDITKIPEVALGDDEESDFLPGRLNYHKGPDYLAGTMDHP